jgi:peptidoglycan/LPS O-acetylase OafA/YrhL
MSAWVVKHQRRLLDLACVLALVGLGLIVWSIVDPRPVPVVLAMSAAQGVGTLSFVIYLVVVLAELRQARVLGKRDEGP